MPSLRCAKVHRIPQIAKRPLQRGNHRSPVRSAKCDSDFESPCGPESQHRPHDTSPRFPRYPQVGLWEVKLVKSSTVLSPRVRQMIILFPDVIDI